MLQEEIYNSNNGARIAYYKIGNANKSILLLHGFAETAMQFIPMAELLQDDYSIIIPNHIGIGSSVSTHIPNSLAELVSPYSNLMRSLNKQQYIVMGHSMGGYMALSLYEQFPNEIAALSLINSNIYADTEVRQEKRKLGMAALNSSEANEFLSTLIPNLYAAEFVSKNKEAIQEHIKHALQIDKSVLANFYELMIRRRDCQKLVSTLSIPIQFIIGQNDITLEHNEHLAQSSKAPLSFVHYFKNCGHTSYIEQKVNCATALKKFIDFVMAY
jgi:pimeloyl-ACP methyl ester carboxylesterase